MNINSLNLIQLFYINFSDGDPDLYLIIKFVVSVGNWGIPCCMIN